MAQFKNISTATLWVSEVQALVAPNAVITVVDADAEGFAGQTAVWQAQDTAATNAVTALTNVPVFGATFLRAGR